MNGNGTSYQYRVNNTVSPRTFCVTVTSNNVSYFSSQAASTPAAGSCQGHGNGVAAITNLIPNPTGASLAGMNGAGAQGNSVVMNGAGAHQGSEYIRRTFTAAGTAGIYRNNLPVTGGEEYWASAWLRASKNVSTIASIEWYASGASAGATTRGAPTNVSGSWTRLSVGGRAPLTADRATINFYAVGNAWADRDYQDIDSLMFTQGPTLHTYADGYSDNWIWNGDPNNSTSTGSPLQ